MRKLLKETGSFYLHCDPTMSHYLKILLDIIFGVKNFRNEIVWCYSRPSAPNQRQLSRVHDIIFWYTKGKSWKFNSDDIRQEYSQSSLSREGYAANKSKMTAGSSVQLSDKGKFPESWIYIPPIKGNSKESLGYPTQKPETLLERIIKASSEEGDVVADFFCGCGTSITVAEKLKRKWLGVDINHLAIGLIESKRLKPLKSEYKVEGFPKDIKQAEILAKEKPFDFEQWVVEYALNGHKTKKTGDGGYDGHITLKFQNEVNLCILEVKGGNCTVKNVREFENVIDKQKADMGIFICFSKQVTKEMLKHSKETENKKVAGGLFNVKKVSILTIEEIIEDNYPSWLESLLNNSTYF